MNMFIKNMEKLTLDQHDIMAIAKPETTTYYTYDNLIKQKSIVDAFKGKNGVFVFYNVKGQNVGHWVCMFRNARNPNMIHYFDPYGKSPAEDIEMTHNKDKFLEMIKKHKSARKGWKEIKLPIKCLIMLLTHADAIVL